MLQNVLKVLKAQSGVLNSAWDKIRAAGKLAAAEMKGSETIAKAHERIKAEYDAELKGPEFQQVRAQFSVALLFALQPAGTIVETKAATSKTAAVGAPIDMVTSWNACKAAASTLREDCGMGSSGRKGTGGRTPVAAAAAPVAPGSMFPGVTTLTMAAPTITVTPLADRWQDFGADVKDALKDEKLRTMLFAILKGQGYNVKPAKAIKAIDAKIEAKIAAMPVPPAGVMAEALIKAANPAAKLN